MARIRTIKPEFPHSESMGAVSREARLCFILLWTLADDSGRLRGNSRMLASLLYPYDTDAGSLMESWLSELEQQKCIIRYQADGSTYLQICNWLIHQKIDKPSRSKIPEFDESSRILANPRERSSEDQRIKDHRIKERDQGSPRKARTVATAPDCPVDVPDDTWRDFLSHRVAIKAPITQTAIDGIRREADKAKMTLADALREICARGWRGFKAEWVKKSPSITASEDDPDDPSTWVHKSLRKPKDIDGEALWTRTTIPSFVKS